MAAYRRSITAKAKLLYEHQHRYSSALSFSHIHHRDYDDSNNKNLKQYSYSSSRIPNFLQNRGSCIIRLQNKRFSFPTGCSPVFTRNFSNSSSVEASNVKIDTLADVLSDKSVDVVAPLLNEVVLATKDASYPVAMFQYLIDNVGNDCANFFLLRTLHLYTSRIIEKATSELSILNKEKDVLLKEMKSSQRMYPLIVAGDKIRMKELNKKLVIGLCIGLAKLFSLKYTINFTYFLAVWNMAEKMPSFKNGGVLWFTDLSTPDSLFIVPVLMALTHLIWEWNDRGRTLDESARIVKNVSRGLYALRIVMYAFLPKAVFFSGITSDLVCLSKMFGKEFMKRRKENAEKRYEDFKMMDDQITKHKFLVHTNREMIDKLGKQADDYEEIVKKRKEDDIKMMNDQIFKHKFLKNSIRGMGENLLKQADDYEEIIKEFQERREKLVNNGPW